MAGGVPFLGFGLGLRAPHFPAILEGRARVDWFEALTENYFGLGDSFGGPALARLLKVRANSPIVLHGVSLSIGGSDPLDTTYLSCLARLIEAVEPAWLSDHLCWTNHGGHHTHDLLPLPRTKAMVDHLVTRIAQVQDRFRQRFLFENISTYVEFSANEMTEWNFLAEVSRRSGCALLLDINNIYVNSKNHGFDPGEYLRGIPRGAVGQIHLAGAVDKGTHLVDTHDRAVRAEVWDLYRTAIQRFGAVSTMIEWDADLPEYSVLEAEALNAREIFFAEGRGRELEYPANSL